MHCLNLSIIHSLAALHKKLYMRLHLHGTNLSNVDLSCRASSDILKSGNLTLVSLGCQNYVKAWGGGQICPTIKKFQHKVENHFFQSLPLFAFHQNNNCQGWSCKIKVPKKSAGGKTLGGGGRSAPPQAN